MNDAVVTRDPDHPTAAPAVAKRLRLAGLLIACGLVVELVTLDWSSPSSFLVFAIVGGTAIGLGILLFLLTIATLRPAGS